MINDRKERLIDLKQGKIDKVREKENTISISAELKKELDIDKQVAAYIDQLNKLAKQNQELRDELERAKVFEAAQAQIKFDEEERIRRETRGLAGLTFEAGLYSKRIPFRIIAQLKYQVDGSSEDLKETLKRWKQHILDFSFSRGDCQILIENIERIEVEEKEKEAEK